MMQNFADGFFKEAKGFDISGAGAKDTEWIGPIYGARQTHALWSHGRRQVKLRHIMWRALNQWKGRILVRGVII